MEKKYRTEPDLETGLLRIIALKDFSDVKKGDRGGLIEKEKNLSQDGDCWIYENAKVIGEALVFGDAKVCGKAEVSNARVYGKAKVYGDAKIFEWADVSDHAQVYGKAKIYGNTQIHGNAKVFGNALVCEAWVCKDAKVSGNVKLWSTNKLSITSSIKNSKDYVILAIGKKFYIFSSHVENPFVKDTSIFDNNYTKNIQIIRQIYGEKI